MKYTFFTRDYFSNSGNFDFTKEQYRILINACFECCRYFSVLIYDQTAYQDCLREWLVPASKFLTHNESHPESRKYFYANNATREFFLENADSIFDFYYSQDHRFPEDPVFYRDDTSVFFDSVVHEGECSIMPTNDESVDEILSFGHWLKIVDGEPVTAAKLVQLKPEKGWEMLNNPLYISLRRLQRAPQNDIPHKDINFLITFIQQYCDEVLAKSIMRIPPTAPRPIPIWYTAFRFYVLGECNAETNVSIANALSQAGFEGKTACKQFFTLLDQFTQYYIDALT